MFFPFHIHCSCISFIEIFSQLYAHSTNNRYFISHKRGKTFVVIVKMEERKKFFYKFHIMSFMPISKKFLRFLSLYFSNVSSCAFHKIFFLILYFFCVKANKQKEKFTILIFTHKNSIAFYLSSVDKIHFKSK